MYSGTKSYEKYIRFLVSLPTISDNDVIIRKRTYSILPAVKIT